ncbi:MULTISPECIES: tetratricopeptide repeat-containing sensor histidine kinase [Bacteroides]|uniref:histidine kinase n=4 Tax=Bacteroides uniformis TaxID=820 RepID=A0A139K8I6_BACUN|nr:MULTISPECIES: sensor histidine kinase [Bacteroides]RJU28275.1 sensor histidine kinase [Bacteroides sp. AM51-7]CUN42685.1 Non-motile and phage-resistance protein [Catenibacterium mitsuokai]KAB3873591.1 sensor histidine kinase [Bacteroides uniformis]KAB3890626.1 sensor histidine kinase [Bacteroides uniformis]KAB3892680.1 sensor histidine kinase [Bacteroides uniformis]
MIIWMLLGQILYTSVLSAHTIANQEKQSILQSLVKRQVLYDDSISIDSVIAWSEQLLPTQQSNEDRTTYFLLQLQLANAYTLRGDISLATNRAQLMYEEAKATDYQFGMVVANQAIGDAYNTIANMGDKALESYQDALTELSNISDQHPYRAQLLLKMSNVLQRKGRLEEAEKILEELEKILYQEPDYPTDFFFCIEKTNFAISHGHLSQDYLDEANIWLHKMDSIYQLHPEKFYRFHLDYTTAAYYRAMGNWDKQYWKQALDIYSKLQAEYSGNKRSTYYRWTSLEKIYLCKIQGMAMEACRIYQELYPPIDTLASQSYIRQINTIKAKYQVDKAETASNNEYNKIITSILVGTMALVTLFVLLAILLKRQREKVKLSTQKLATSRINAENAMRAKSVFLSNMSHEIRTPLNALSGFSSLLTEEGLDDETRRQCNEVIQQNSELLLKLINDVIDLSSLEFGKLQFCIAQHDAVSICRNVIDTVNKVKQTQAELTFTTELEEMPIETDDSRLQQVLINLLINATKFTPQGSIVLKLEKETDDTVLFTVTDTGCGIPKDKQANIFQRFEKLNENAQGSGLGLSICQLIIEHIGGQIWIDSEYAEGSRFCFTHPISQKGRKENKK